jgi:hypothetical protein
MNTQHYESAKTIPLSNGGEVIVDVDEYDRLSQYKWHLFDGYACRSKYLPDNRRRTQRMHREIMDLDIGDKIRVDHINRNRLDNRKCNLRTCNQSQNAMNSVPRRNNNTGYKGVSYYSPRKKFRAMISKDYKQIAIGYFSDPEEAAYVYDQFAIQLHGVFARRNII